MRYYIDTEFSERPCTIELISLALVAEDGRELYCVSKDFAVSECNLWVQRNVIPNLAHPGDPFVQGVTRDPLNMWLDRPAIAAAVRHFVGLDKKPEFWGYYADYDWVVFCWLFGPMVDLPKGWPQYCRDIKQWADQLGSPQLPHKSESHNALEDARCISKNYDYLDARAHNPYRKKTQ